MDNCYSFLIALFSLIGNQVSNMNKDSEVLESGELSDESYFCKEITWKISGALKLRDLMKESATFPFAGATWKFRLYLNGLTSDPSEEFIGLNIIRMNSQFPEQGVLFEFRVVAENGEEFENYSTFRNFPLSTLSARRFLWPMKNSAFVDNKDIFPEDGDLTIHCIMMSKKVAVIDRYFQKEVNETFPGKYNSYILHK